MPNPGGAVEGHAQESAGRATPIDGMLAQYKTIQVIKEISYMQTNRVFRRVGAALGLIALFAMMSLPVVAKSKKPVVAIIKAEWCSACQKLEPTMMDLMKQYGDRLEFVVLDVSNEDTLAEANKTAKKHGLSDFLKENQKKTSTVAVFSGNKVLFQTVQNFDRDAYVKAFDKALAES